VSIRFLHRGIRYSVRKMGQELWRWEVLPPAGVLGMFRQTGQVDGDKRDAMRAARAAIEIQTGQYTN
jgi:hypothetical protein